jgi:hypothetical protein
LFDRLQGELEAREKSPGLTMSDILSLPDPFGRLCNWMLRCQQATVPEVAAFLQEDEAQAAATLAGLVERGFAMQVDVQGVTYYRVRLAAKRGRNIPLNLWQALEGKVEE